MRKDFDYLLRSTLFLSRGTLDSVIAECQDLGFRHILLGEHCWSRSAGWYESSLPGGHSDLKRFVQDAHNADLLVSLHTRDTRVFETDPFTAYPTHPELDVEGNLYFVDPYTQLQQEIAENLVKVADLVMVDGLYLDGAEVSARKYPDKVADAITVGQRAVIDKLSRPMLLQSSSALSTLHEYWCWKGQIDHYIHKVKSGYTGTRADWNAQYFHYVEQAWGQGYPSQVGWIDFGYGHTYKDNPIEDQSPESMQQLCDYASAHNLPIVLQCTLEELSSHPKTDEIKAVIRTFHRMN